MRNLVFSFSLLLALFATTLAQSNTGNLTGTVTDASGVIAGANIVVKDNQTGKERNLVSNEEGSFSVAQMDIGEYTVTITAPGHKTQTYNNVKSNNAST